MDCKFPAMSPTMKRSRDVHLHTLSGLFSEKTTDASLCTLSLPVIFNKKARTVPFLGQALWSLLFPWRGRNQQESSGAVEIPEALEKKIPSADMGVKKSSEMFCLWRAACVLNSAESFPM